MEDVIDKTSNINRYKMMLDNREKCVAHVIIEREILDAKVVETFLTIAGMKIGKQDDTNAQALARRVMKSSTNGELKKRFNCDIDGYTRTDLNNMFLFYLSKRCGIDWFTTFASIEDDQLWYAFFPETKHTCGTIKDLPEIDGAKKYQERANTVRRRQMSELLILGDLFNLLTGGSNNCFIDTSICNDLPANTSELMEKASVHIYRTYEALSKITDAHEWISKESSKYDIDWLKKEANLDFLNPAAVKFTKSGIYSMISNREMLFDLTYSESM